MCTPKYVSYAAVRCWSIRTSLCRIFLFIAVLCFSCCCCCCFVFPPFNVTLFVYKMLFAVFLVCCCFVARAISMLFSLLLHSVCVLYVLHTATLYMVHGSIGTWCSNGYSLARAVSLSLWQCVFLHARHSAKYIHFFFGWYALCRRRYSHSSTHHSIFLATVQHIPRTPYVHTIYFITETESQSRYTTYCQWIFNKNELNRRRKYAKRKRS